MSKEFRPDTICVQAGWKPKKGEPRVLPIYQSTTFKYDTTEEMGRLFALEEDGYFYSRLQNPTREQLEKVVASLENGIDAIAFSTGMAAITMMMELFKPGDHLIVDSEAADVVRSSFQMFAEGIGYVRKIIPKGQGRSGRYCHLQFRQHLSGSDHSSSILP